MGALLTFGIGFSQNTFPTASNTAVGIGTGATAVSGAGGLRLKITSGVANTSGVQLTNLTSNSPTTSGLLGKALSVNSTGNLVLVPISNTDISIYTTDGILTTDRTVGLKEKNLTFNPSTANSQFFINGTNGKIGIGTMLPTAKLEIKGGEPNGTIFSSLDERFEKSILLNVGSLAGTSTKYRSIRFFDFPQSNFDAKSNIWFGIEDRNDMGRFRMGAQANGSTGFKIMNKSQQNLFDFYEDGNDNVTLTMQKENSALEEINAETKKSKRTILNQITFENYSYYLGFNKL